MSISLHAKSAAFFGLSQKANARLEYFLNVFEQLFMMPKISVSRVSLHDRR